MVYMMVCISYLSLSLDIPGFSLDNQRDQRRGTSTEGPRDTDAARQAAQQDQRERDITSVPASLADEMIAPNNEHCPQSNK